MLNLINILLVFINFTGWNSTSVEYQWSRGKSVNKLWEKLSNMSINTGLDIKPRFVWEKKKACNSKWNITYFGEMLFEIRGRIVFVSDNFQLIITLVDYRFIMFP